MCWCDYFHKAHAGGNVSVFFSFVWFAYVAMCFSPALHNVHFIYAYGTIEPVCAESAVKHQQTKPNQQRGSRWMFFTVMKNTDRHCWLGRCAGRLVDVHGDQEELHETHNDRIRRHIQRRARHARRQFLISKLTIILRQILRNSAKKIKNINLCSLSIFNCI